MRRRDRTDADEGTMSLCSSENEKREKRSMAWRDTVDYYVSLSFTHMVGDSCWGHHCWPLNLAQPTGRTHTSTHIKTGLSLIFFSLLTRAFR